MSTQPNLTPQWKEEVNRRIAAHKNRKTSNPGSEISPQGSAPGASRAAEAAARVAARYAKAPSYSQLQAEEARVAVRHAEIATKVALQAQAAAESAIAELHAAAQEQPSRGPAVVQPIALSGLAAPNPQPARLPVHAQAPPRDLTTDQAPTHLAPDAPAVAAPVEGERPSFGIRWDPDLPVRPLELKPTSNARRAQEEFELSVEDWWSPAEAAENLRHNPIEVAEGEPEHANLIQFPRELVATRKIRPRLVEASITEAEGQLSIFEVDPGANSTAVEARLGGQDAPASIWNRPDWSGIRLDHQPVEQLASASTVDPAPKRFPVAPMGLRLMAAAVDCALILASFVTAGFLVAHQFSHPPQGKAGEVIGGVMLVLIGLMYYAFFFAFPVGTPGMRYAGIGLCTFDDKSPTREQLRRRLGAMALSLLPVGLGIAWSIFDDDHMSWHDRYSQTYLRKL